MSAVEYRTFEIKIRRGSDARYELDIRSPAGERTTTFRVPMSPQQLTARLQSLEIALLRSTTARRDFRIDDRAEVIAFGTSLFEMLFGSGIEDLYRLSRRMTQAESRGLRLQLRVEAPELASLPWEFLFDPSEGDFVCLSRETPVVRYLELDRPLTPLLVQAPLRVLGVVASPTDRAPLDVGREKRRVEDAVAGLQRRGLLELSWLPGQSLDALQKAMVRGPWHVFHFVGHGTFDPSSGEGVIALVNDDGSTFRLAATKLGRLLADHPTLRLAVLNACDGARSSDANLLSSSAAILTKRGLPAVVAMQREITDGAAVEFARVFYDNLAEGLPVDAAVTEARKAISITGQNSLEWSTPVLYLRAPDGVLFDVHRAGPVPRPPDRADTPNEASHRAPLRRLAWLALPTVVLLTMVLGATIWRLPTRVAVNVVTSRVTFEVRDDDVPVLTGPGFARLVIEHCKSAAFQAASLLPVEPSRRAESSSYVGDVRLQCNDPSAKLTLEGATDSSDGIGSLDRLTLKRGSRVALAVAGTTAPVVTIDVSTSAVLDLAIAGAVRLTADFVDAEQDLGFPIHAGALDVQLNEANRWFHVETEERRSTFVVTPSDTSGETFFDPRVSIPVEDAEFLQETSAGLVPAFLQDGALTYPDYPQVPPLSIRGDDFLVLRQTAGLEIRRLGVWNVRPALALTLEGRVSEAGIVRPAAMAPTEARTGQRLDPRLTVYDVVRFGPWWSLMAAVASWGVATTWAWHEGWKKLSNVSRATGDNHDRDS